jgi:hypothetical protein
MGDFSPIDTGAEHADVKSWAQTLEGTGLRRTAAVPRKFSNAIAWEFQVTPKNVASEPNVAVDLSRRAAHIEWMDWNGLPLRLTSEEKEDYPAMLESSNDDPVEDDESFTPDAEGRMYSIDAPASRELPHVVVPATAKIYYNFDANFEEFARASFDGSPLEGNGVQGTRASPMRTWHSNTYLRYIPADMDWFRAKADGTANGPAETAENTVDEGQVELDQPPKLE